MHYQVAAGLGSCLGMPLPHTHGCGLSVQNWQVPFRVLGTTHPRTTPIKWQHNRRGAPAEPRNHTQDVWSTPHPLCTHRPRRSVGDLRPGPSRADPQAMKAMQHTLQALHAAHFDGRDLCELL